MKKVKYLLMRHGHYYDSKNQFITYHGMLQLKSSIEKLEIEIKKIFPYLKVRIVHSEIQRAKHTALLIKDMMSVGVELSGNSNLNCHEYKINDTLVKKIVSDAEKDKRICIILSHQPDIEIFCKKDLYTSQYIIMETEIEEEVIEEDHDDLPF